MLLRRLAIATLAALAPACADIADDEGEPALPATTTTTTRLSTTSSRPTTTTTTAQPATTTTTVASTTTTVESSPDLRPLRRGHRGDDVAALQQRLEALRYWVGPVDGVFGWLTEQAVFAFEKAHALPVDGVVDTADRDALADPAPLRAQSTDGVVWEIDKTAQLLKLAQDGEVTWAWNTSTGTEQPYTHDGRRKMADTPVGQYQVEWDYDGVRNGSLGRLYRPKYFHRDGLAIHGYGRVPPQPASHGCVRVTFAAMDFIWSTEMAPVGAAIWVYGTTPPVD